MTKKIPTFDFGEPSDSAKKALDLLKARRKPGTSDDDALAKWAIEALMTERLRRLWAIADYYGVDLFSRFGGEELALRLAMDSVPNFDPLRSLNGPGRPRSTSHKHFALAASLEAIMKENNCSISNACHILDRRPGPWRGKGAAAIEKAFERFKKAREQESKAVELALDRMRTDAKVMLLSQLGMREDDEK